MLYREVSNFAAKKTHGLERDLEIKTCMIALVCKSWDTPYFGQLFKKKQMEEPATDGSNIQKALPGRDHDRGSGTSLNPSQICNKLVLKVVFSKRKQE